MIGGAVPRWVYAWCAFCMTLCMAVMMLIIRRHQETPVAYLAP
jgi:hypothetical protein